MRKRPYDSLSASTWPLGSSGLLGSAWRLISLLKFWDGLSGSHLHGSRIQDGNDRFSRNVLKELTTTSCVIAQKSAVLICFAAWRLKSRTSMWIIFLCYYSSVSIFVKLDVRDFDLSCFPFFGRKNVVAFRDLFRRMAMRTCGWRLGNQSPPPSVPLCRCLSAQSGCLLVCAF
jgi:hypothetical protein